MTEQCEAKTTKGTRCKKRAQVWKVRDGRAVALCKSHKRPYWPIYENNEQKPKKR